ncbi:KH domain-containing, RNA-binding, signal transduction-associated protein 2-like isoform X1 [Neocloeon triangulifer]|uniref:KH domain-containing, RNA-binding, signal transduction-associated protein 2-like isoform X1 n=1 Tax=Neocloeon triangulifer TaxID=2078957 RepID=UPI00286EEA87|nr:KH domain-containing, RNA-binding, signal transduction-associated protein 2-like isoform X1 [Neocloeon triangulifer]
MMSDECSVLLDQNTVTMEQPGSDAGSCSTTDNQPTSPEDYIRLLAAERSALELQSPGCALTLRLISQELERVQSTGRLSREEKRTFADITKEKPIKVSVRVLVPIREHPKFNFVGKLLGPKGNSLKRLQEETMTKMAILGRGSMRDKQKEEELRGSTDPKFSHLNDDLHVEVTAFAPPAEAHARIAYALAEIRKFLVPDYNDEIRQEQMREIQLMNAGTGAVIPNPASSEAAVAAAAAAASLANATAVGKVVSPRCPQPAPGMILHPALRELGRAQGLIPAATMFRGASILSRVRPTIPIPGTRGASSPAPKRSILTLLGRVGRNPGTGVDENGLETGDDSGAAAAAAAAAAVYGLYDGYAAAPGYGLLEDYTNGAGLSEDVEDMSQDSVNGAVAAAEFAARPEGGALKVAAGLDRARYRHDPYARLIDASFHDVTEIDFPVAAAAAAALFKS